MDPVVEASDIKDEIDFEGLKVAPFKKLKLLTDFEEDKKIKANTDTGSLYIYNNTYDCDEAIAEDNREDDIEIDKDSSASAGVPAVVASSVRRCTSDATRAARTASLSR